MADSEVLIDFRKLLGFRHVITLGERGDVGKAPSASLDVASEVTSEMAKAAGAIFNKRGEVPSDIRLKGDIVRLGRLDNGIGLYRYRYLWSDEIYVGVMAQEAAAIVPDAVIRRPDGYLAVNYGRLGLRLTTWHEWTGRSQPVAAAA